MLEQINDLLCERSQRGMFVTLCICADAAERTILCQRRSLPPLLGPARRSLAGAAHSGGPRASCRVAAAQWAPCTCNRATTVAQHRRLVEGVIRRPAVWLGHLEKVMRWVFPG
jgi:hypothetical protein